MTIKLSLLKSGEEVISDMSEMMSGKDGGGQVVGYFFKYPCVASLVGNPNPREIEQEDEGEYEQNNVPLSIKLMPWMPLSKDKTIPVVADWIISIVEPQDSLVKMYKDMVKKYEDRKSQNSSSDEQGDYTDSDRGSDE